jgi:uncharacterized Ntn-hydrolase superfamily protein
VTFSIVAHDAESWGVAVASKCLAVGFAVPWGRAGVGAVATQALANLSYGPDGLAALAEGHSAAEVVERLTAADPQQEHRQLGVVDAAGRAANHTGGRCLDWAGGETGDGVALQGNLLAGPQVLAAMAEAWRSTAAEPFPRRLLAAVQAGDRAGGDRRGRQSAALRVWRHGAAYGGGLDLAVDLRVDDHADPTAELARLLGLQELYFGRPDPASLLPLRGGLAEEVAAGLAALGYHAGAGGLQAALDEWVGVENYEERMGTPGMVDPVVLEQLRRQVEAGR